MPKITIGITGLNAIDSPGPGVAVIRAVRETTNYNIRIIGLSYEALEPGLYMHDIVDKSYQIPYPSAGSASLKKRLQYIHEQEQLDVIIPNFDAELRNFIRLAPTLKKWGIKTYLPSLEKMEQIDKMNLADFGKKHGFKVPKTHYISASREIKDLEAKLDFPVVVKGKYYEAHVAHSPDQILTFYYKLSAKWGFPVLVQEFVSGTEIDIAGLGNGAGKLIGAVPIRKLYITDKGKGWAGITLEDEELITMAEKFTKASGWKGGFELELMKTDEEAFYLMEVNPRFPAWIYTAAAAGQNLPLALVQLALGENNPEFSKYEVGVMFVRYSWDLITNIKEFEQINTMGEL